MLLAGKLDGFQSWLASTLSRTIGFDGSRVGIGGGFGGGFTGGEGDASGGGDTSGGGGDSDGGGGEGIGRGDDGGMACSGRAYTSISAT